MRNEAEVNRAIYLYADTVRRICFLYLKNDADVDDIFQEVFLKYLLHSSSFESDAHEKAWLIRVSINACQDLLKSFFRRRVRSIEEVTTEPFYLQEEDKGLLDAVFRLAPKYRNTIYLFYYEGYKVREISEIKGKNENTIHTWLKRGREALREKLGGELDDFR